MKSAPSEPEPASSPSSPAVAPHPVLGEYYDGQDSRRSKVSAMFDAGAAHYDWITDLMSFGSGRNYRSRALMRHGLSADTRLLDVGSGTGALALIAQRVVRLPGCVVALDPSRGMLAQAREAGVERAVVARAESIPVPDGAFDLLSMSYALRHVADLNATFREYRRVLEPGGRVLLLEITRPGNRFALSALRLYLRGLVPLIARLFRRSQPAEELMRYYWDTIEHCVPPETILQALSDSGFERAERRVELGIFSEYVAVAA